MGAVFSLSPEGAASLARSLMWDGLRQARYIGHKMTWPEPEEQPWEYVSCCELCGQYVAVDISNAKRPIGGALTRRCTRRKLG